MLIFIVVIKINRSGELNLKARGSRRARLTTGVEGGEASRGGRGGGSDWITLIQHDSLTSLSPACLEGLDGAVVLSWSKPTAMDVCWQYTVFKGTLKWAGEIRGESLLSHVCHNYPGLSSCLLSGGWWWLSDEWGIDCDIISVSQWPPNLTIVRRCYVGAISVVFGPCHMTQFHITKFQWWEKYSDTLLK